MNNGVFSLAYITIITHVPLHCRLTHLHVNLSLFCSDLGLQIPSRSKTRNVYILKFICSILEEQHKRRVICKIELKIIFSSNRNELIKVSRKLPKRYSWLTFEATYQFVDHTENYEVGEASRVHEVQETCKNIGLKVDLIKFTYDAVDWN
jgi:hypothetical protein